ncbi:hypothetical protein [Rathayibacter iranicus]|uniref:Uncharacterized protein n=1 Tax=Rathayibacter iranicus NCPPB 2253 = VKM Ac-1602 TaxID=1328868 RepID=A0ABX5LC71_9MICO|nr:hypothetical protein [Rathayibacter iranicus]MWV32472.1 hypothetical protein [Rathayibacter iranicus NCPPB 2253 = VKM Ac-1602]PWJ61205.1 hypothetical protein B0H03_11942 [Rathayibacter iranicus NCPPB 2253 = VKM Ac-1602]
MNTGSPAGDSRITILREELSKRLRLLLDEYDGRQPAWSVIDAAVRTQGADLSRTKWF